MDMVDSPAFTDLTASYYTVYYYAVSAVDADGLESVLSEAAEMMLVDSRSVWLSGVDFESGFGDWVNITGEDFTDWTRHSGGTLTPATGPSGGANGSSWYVYLETSPGGANAAGNTAILESPLIGGFGRILPGFGPSSTASSGQAVPAKNRRARGCGRVGDIQCGWTQEAAFAAARAAS